MRETGFASSNSFVSEGIRSVVRDIAPSQIREVAHLGMGRDDVVPLWFGEPDQPTPEFICRAAMDALAAGDTFYQPNAGIAPLRTALSDYMNGLYGTALLPDNVIVTVSGLNAIMVALQAVLGAGDHLVTTAPIWPNLVAIPRVLGASVTTVPLQADAKAGWQLDLQALFDACRPSTKVILLNTPNNPTGWMMSEGDQAKLVAFAEERGIWIIADEVYARLVYNGQDYAPSFVPFLREDRRIMVINSFSKAWAMTGWRLGWITASRAACIELEKLMEFNVSCPAGFIQQAGIVALREGEDFVATARACYARSRQVLVDRLSAMPRVMLPAADAAFYAFFHIDGVTDTLGFAKKLLGEQGIGLAPGEAFGPEGAGFIRACYAVSEDRIHQAMDGMERFLNTM
ncbi:aspartate aminotransferase [Thalassospira profundimaris]|uniref:Aminotransferase n=1 Tax=Thalassospira profundimaris TaxID=502049 RepID=A0A367XIY7_9PROT|nr:pyridoxal phosphate-dependent aminotransferase [Thalassospira profundimaris]RCK53614.1 aspartate aminotransferase [Thalassospira profundimaris]